MLQAQPVQLVHKDLKAFKVYKEHRAHRGCKGYRACLVIQAPQALKDHRAM